MSSQVHIIGGGLAGSEAAWQLAEAGIAVRLTEMRGSGEMTAAHQTDALAELVCSNSFRSDDAENNAVGLLHAEMRALGSLIMSAADAHKVPAGSALAVDRDGFSAEVTARLNAHPNIKIVRERVDALPDSGATIVATGPLTAARLAESIGVASGEDTLRFGPMKPVGLDDPRTGRWPYAVVQLRQDNKLGTLWNMVGFQTKLKHAEQVRLFRTIPGLENAEFARLGGLHRNTFINSPQLLDSTLRLKQAPHIRFAGQITGCEGYVESAAVGLMAGRFAAAELEGKALAPPPPTTALGALLGHITGGADAASYQPMNVNFGLMPPLEGPKTKKADRKKLYTSRAADDLETWRAAL